MKRFIATATLAVIATAVPTAANATQVEPADRAVAKLKVIYAEPAQGRQAFVELNDGSAYTLRPCRLEDSNHCYWDASSRGNGRGRDFVSLRGKAIYVKAANRSRVVWH